MAMLMYSHTLLLLYYYITQTSPKLSIKWLFLLSLSVAFPQDCMPIRLKSGLSPAPETASVVPEGYCPRHMSEVGSPTQHLTVRPSGAAELQFMDSVHESDIIHISVIP